MMQRLRQKDRDGKDKFKDLGNMIKNTQAVQDLDPSRKQI